MSGNATIRSWSLGARTEIDSEHFGSKLRSDSSETEQGSEVPQSLLAQKREKHGKSIRFDA